MRKQRLVPISKREERCERGSLSQAAGSAVEQTHFTPSALPNFGKDPANDDTSLVAAEELVAAVRNSLNASVRTSPGEALKVQAYLQYVWSDIDAFIARISELLASDKTFPSNWIKRAVRALENAIELERQAVSHFSEGQHIPDGALWPTSMDWDENLEALRICEEKLYSATHRSAPCLQTPIAVYG